MLENKPFKQKIKKIDFWSQSVHLASHSPRFPMESPKEFKNGGKSESALKIREGNQTIGRESQAISAEYIAVLGLYWMNCWPAHHS